MSSVSEKMQSFQVSYPSSVSNSIPTIINLVSFQILVLPFGSITSDLLINISSICSFYRLLAVPVLTILQKYLRVDVSSGSYICQLPNPYEID